MARFVMLLGAAVLVCGCDKQYEYAYPVEQAASQVDPVIHASKWVATDANPGTNAIVLRESREIGTGTPELFPFALHNRRAIPGGYEWNVSQDVSGIFREAGRLRIRGTNHVLLVDAPNEVVERFIVQTLKLQKSGRSSDVDGK